MALGREKPGRGQPRAQMTRRAGSPVEELDVGPEHLGDLPAHERVMSAAEDHRTDGARKRSDVAADHLGEVGLLELPVLDTAREPGARHRDDLAILAVGRRQVVILVERERDVGGHDEDPAVARRLGRRLERRFDANNRQVRIGVAQRRSSNGGRRVARDHNGFGPLRDESLHDAARELEHLRLGLLAVRGVGRVAEVMEVLARELGHERPQHAGAADAGVEDADEAVRVGAHATPPLTCGAWRPRCQGRGAPS